MKRFILYFAVILGSASHAKTVCTTCYRPLDAATLERLTGIKLEVPSKIDIIAQLKTFATVPETQRLSDVAYDTNSAAGYLMTTAQHAQILKTYATLTVEDIAVDLDHVKSAKGLTEIPVVASVRWARADAGSSGQTWIHARVRPTNMRINDKERRIAELNAGLATAIKVDVLAGDKGLAASEDERRALVREVIFPAVLAQGYAPLLNLWTDQVAQWLKESFPKAIGQTIKDAKQP